MVEQPFGDPQTLFSMVEETYGDQEQLPEEQIIEVEKPVEERFKYGSKEHDDLLAKLVYRRKLGEAAISDRDERWDDIDNHMKMRLDLSQGAIMGDRTRSTTKKEMPFRRSIVIPAMFANLLVRVTQETSIVLGREPALQYDGVGPEDIDSAALLEATVAYDLRQMAFPLVAHQLFWDSERYGIGIVYDTWERDYGWKLSRPMMSVDQLGPMGKLMKRMMPGMFEWGREWVLRKEHNLFLPVDPRRFYPDPRTPLARIQEAEFVGHGTLKGYMQLAEKSIENEGPYFNLKAVKEHCGHGKVDSRKRWVERITDQADEYDRGAYCVDHLQVRLIPKEWKLGPGTKPERWWFTWVDDTVVIRAHRSPYAHDQFTYAVGESIPDYHSMDNPGWGEQMDGLQRLVNWIYNSHIESTRRAINNAMVYPPSLIEEADLIHPTPGGHIRLTPRGEQMVLRGQVQVGSLYSLLSQPSVTQHHLSEAQFLMQQMQVLAGTNDPAQGQPLSSKRTLGEIETIMGSASQRVATTMRLIDHQVLRPLAVRAGMNRQQLTEMEQWYRITGDLARDIEKRELSRGQISSDAGGLRALVTRDDIAGNFDYVAHAADAPQDPARSAETWMQLFQLVSQSMQSFMDPSVAADGRIPDIREIFNESMRKAGIRNIENFYREMPPPPPPQPQPGAEVQVVPDEQYAQQVQAGNYVSPEQV